MKNWFSKWFGSSQRGFTFVELVMVMAIIGTMAAITVTSSQQYLVDQGKEAALKVEKQIIASAAFAHVKDGGSLPVTDSDLYRSNYLESKPTLADYVIDTHGHILQTPR